MSFQTIGKITVVSLLVWPERREAGPAALWICRRSRIVLRRSTRENGWIAKRAVIAGMRPGEIFALIWGRLTETRDDAWVLMRTLGVDGKLVADQFGHSLVLNQNVLYPVTGESRLAAVNQWEKSLQVM